MARNSNDFLRWGDIEKAIMDYHAEQKQMPYPEPVVARWVCDAVEGALYALEDVPAADVAEVRHGKWEYYECVSSYDGAISGYSCSVCSAFIDEDIFETDEFHKDYCGCCGAKMDLEE